VSTDLGSGHSYSRYVDTDGNWIGIIDHHLKPDGRPCGGGAVLFDLPVNADVAVDKWTLVSRNPFHLEPSLLCRLCGDHGFIRNGAWEKA
jgi:hypothetical protein